MQNSQYQIKGPIGLSPVEDSLHSECSCTKCDSVDCFVKRRAPCPCGTYTDHKSCHFSPKSDSDYKKPQKKHLTHTTTDRNITKEHTTRKTICKSGKNCSKKTSREKSHKFSDSRNELKETTGYFIVASDHHKNISTTTAELSAQIMNLTYKDCQKSVSKSSFPNVTNLSPFDILNRIKEAYKACSCKVCECIGGKSLQNGMCKCKPCDCNECVGFNRPRIYMEPEKVPKVDKGDCLCIRCNKESCNAIARREYKLLQNCDSASLLKCKYLSNYDDFVVQDCSKFVHSFTEVGKMKNDKVQCSCMKCNRESCKALSSQLKREFLTNDDLIQEGEELMHNFTDDESVPRDGEDPCIIYNRQSYNVIRHIKNKSKFDYPDIEMKGGNLKIGDKHHNLVEAPDDGEEGCSFIKCNRGSNKGIRIGKTKSAHAFDFEDSPKCNYLKNLDILIQPSEKVLQTCMDNSDPKKDQSGCPCIRCDRGSCKAFIQPKKKSALCDCVGLLKCEYIKNLDNLVENCNCEPCECMECTPALIQRQRNVIVAPVGDEYSHRTACQCSPCECSECVNNNNGLSSNQHHEMSTGVDRHPNCHCETCQDDACVPDNNQICKCERQNKVMSKPFQQDSHDYDIRRTIITYDDPLRYKEKYDTIAMFTAVNNLYPKREASIDQCDCEPCECLICKYGESSSKLTNPIQNYKRVNENNDCKCSRCECLLCTEYQSKPQKLKKERNRYDVSTYFNRYGSKISKSIFSTKDECQYKLCECTECENILNNGECQFSKCKCDNCIIETHSDEVIYPVKRGDRMTPSVYRKRIKDAYVESCVTSNTIDVNDENFKRSSVLKPLFKKPLVFNSIRTPKTAKDDIIDTSKSFQDTLEQILPLNFITFPEKHGENVKCPNTFNMHGRYFEEMLEPNLSTNHSVSFAKDSGSISHSKSKLKSWESSCNSSGHDCSTCLIHFPKTPVNAYPNEETQFDSSINSLDAINMCSENNVRKQHLNTDMSKSQLMRSVFFGEKPKNNINGASESELNNYFEYSFQNFEDNPYRPNNLETTSKDIIQDTFRTANQKKFISAPNNTNYFTFDRDYDRVQNTLNETRSFSLKLVKLLEKYEKANREFESVSEKIKKANEAEFSPNNKNLSKHARVEASLEDLFDIDNIPTKGQVSRNLSKSANELVETNKIIDNTHLSGDDNQNYNISSKSNTVVDNNDGRDESGDDEIKISHDLLRTITEEREPIDDHKQEKLTKQVHSRHINMFKCSDNRPKSTCIKSLRGSSSVNIEPTAEINSKPFVVKKEIETKTEKRTTTTIDHRKKFDKVNKNEVTPKVEEVNLLKGVKKSDTELSDSTIANKTKNGFTLQNKVVIIKEPMVEPDEDNKEKTWAVLKKHVCMSTNGPRDLFPSLTILEKNIKTASKTTSKQTEVENTSYIFKNKALVKLQTEVHKLLRMPILQSIEGPTSRQQKQMGKPNPFCPYLSTPSSSQTIKGFRQAEQQNIVKSPYMAAECSKNPGDSMKVNFLTVRRVSDHTVLVKWNTPRVLANIEGYELLVDGRAVQKILSPWHCIAVVTCLPHNDKVVLTVRTVLLSLKCPEHAPGHNPAVTVIYQPKGKSNM